MTAPCLRFGKHKGVPLARVPLAYLTWLTGQDNLRAHTKSMLDSELARRQAADANDGPDDDVLPEALRADETTHVSTRCPHCSRSIMMTIELGASQ